MIRVTPHSGKGWVLDIEEAKAKYHIDDWLIGQMRDENWVSEEFDDEADDTVILSWTD